MCRSSLPCLYDSSQWSAYYAETGKGAFPVDVTEERGAALFSSWLYLRCLVRQPIASFSAPLPGARPIGVKAPVWCGGGRGGERLQRLGRLPSGGEEAELQGKRFALVGKGSSVYICLCVCLCVSVSVSVCVCVREREKNNAMTYIARKSPSRFLPAS